MTTHEAEVLAARYGANEETISVIPPGVHSTASPPGWPDGPPTVVFIGRLSASKRLDVLAEAVKLVWQERSDCRIVVAGAAAADGSDPTKPLRELGSPSPDRLQILPDVTQVNKTRLIESAGVLVSASERESFGLTILEAWAAARPVVVADTPVMRSIVRPGVDGELFSPGNPSSLAAEILGLLRDTPRAESLGLEGYARVVDEFSWDRSTQQLEMLYRSL